MTTQDLLTADEKRILLDAYGSAVDANKIISKYVDEGFPYTEHQQKSVEQLDFLRKILDLHGIEY